MKSNQEIIMAHTGAMSRGILRKKLDMLYSEKKILGKIIKESKGFRNIDSNGRSLNDVVDDKIVLISTIRQLCTDASERKYGNMTIQQIQKKWDASDHLGRNQMLEFLYIVDEFIEKVKANWGKNDNHYVITPWIDLDNQVKSRFAMYAKSDLKKTMKVVT